MPNKTPAAASRHAVLKGKRCGNCIFCLIQSATIGMETAYVDYRAEELLEEIYLVGGQIIEVSASSDIALYTPRQIGTVVVKVAWWN